MFFVWNIATTHTHTFVAKSAFSRVWSEKKSPYFCIWSRTYYIFKENFIFFSGSDSYNTFNCSFLLLLVLCNICHHYPIPYYYTNIWEWLKSSDFGMYLAIDMVSTLYYIDLQTTNSFKKESILPSTTTTACVLVWFLVFLHYLLFYLF